MMTSIFFRTTRSLLALGIFFFASNHTNAQFVAWDMDGAPGNDSTLAATVTDPDLITPILTRGSGINAAVLANSFSSNDWADSTLAGAVSTNDYLEFTLQAQPGFKFSLDSLKVVLRRSGAGPNMFQWQYSLDGFATAGVDMGSTVPYTTNPTAGEAQATIDLTTTTALQNVISGTSVTMRLYAWGATATGGTFAVGRLLGNDLELVGSVDPLTVGISPLSTGAPNIRAWLSGDNIVIEHDMEQVRVINVQICNMSGAVVYERSHRSQGSRLVLGNEGLSNGLWLLRVTDQVAVHTIALPIVR